MEEIIKTMGFQNMAEFNRLVASADLSTPQRLLDFKKWQTDDGSKDGLMKLQVSGEKK